MQASTVPPANQLGVHDLACSRRWLCSAATWVPCSLSLSPGRNVPHEPTVRALPPSPALRRVPGAAPAPGRRPYRHRPQRQHRGRVPAARLTAYSCLGRCLLTGPCPAWPLHRRAAHCLHAGAAQCQRKLLVPDMHSDVRGLHPASLVLLAYLIFIQVSSLMWVPGSILGLKLVAGAQLTHHSLRCVCVSPHGWSVWVKRACRAAARRRLAGGAGPRGPQRRRADCGGATDARPRPLPGRRAQPHRGRGRAR